MRLVALAWLLMVSVSGCTLALGYPSAAERETSCSDTQDEDLDGLVDCDDTDCDGQCPELASDTCDDGRDQDGDGLIDVDDPGCWPHLRIVPGERCATSGPSAWSSSFSPNDWSAEPTVTSHVFVRQSIPSVEVRGGDDLVSTEVIAGRTEGLQMRLAIDWIGCPTSTLRLGLARSSTALDPRGGARDGILLEVEPVDCALRRANVIWSVAGTRTPAGAFSGPIAGTVAVADGTLRGAFPVVMDTAIRDGLASLPPGVPLRFMISATGSDDSASAWLVGAPTASRGDYQPCGFDVPQIPSTVVAMSALRDGSLCALTEVSGATGTSLVSQRSTDGITWTPLAGPTIDPGPLGGATLQLAPDGTLRGAILRTRARPTGTDASDVLLITSPDCSSWDVVETNVAPVLPPSISPRGLGLRVTDAETRITLVLRDPPSLIDLVSSSFGPPFRGQAAEPLTMTGPVREGIALGLRPIFIGNDRLMLASTASGAGLYLHAPDPMRQDPWVALGAPLVAPSNLDGTFDRTTIEGLAVVPWGGSSDRLRLAVAYGGGPRGTCPACTFPTATTLVELVR